jgi:uncharacterized alpha-E superfamily protein
MLSRIADSLFWIARYMERAEDTARILDVCYHMMLEQANQPLRLRWEQLIVIIGAQEQFGAFSREANPYTVLEFLGFSSTNPDAILQCVAQARENARTIRDRISREMWEDINTLYHEVSRFTVDQVIAAGPHRFCSLIKFGSHRFNGVSDATLPHDEGWHFLQAGRALERAQMTARIIDVQYHTLLAPNGSGTQPAAADGGGIEEPDNHQWMAVLKSVAAYEYYRRQYNSRIEPKSVVELLVLNPLHPRSICSNVTALQAALRAISGTGPGRYANEAERLVGKLRDTLVYDRVEEIFARGLHTFLSELQRTCRAIGDDIARSYFYYAA